MTDTEFQAWLRELVEHRHMTQPQMHDLLSQKALFNSRFGEGDDPRRRNLLHRIVGYIADELIEGRGHPHSGRSSGARLPRPNALFRADRLRSLLENFMADNLG